MAEKLWNGQLGRWEIDGVPVTYRVTWKNIDNGDENVREFTDVDQGYSFFEMMKRDAHSSQAKWEHVPW